MSFCARWAALASAPALCVPATAFAEDLPPGVAELRVELDALRQDQKRIDGRIGAIEAALDRIASTGTPAAGLTPATFVPVPLPASAPLAPQGGSDPARLKLSGDLRLRYELNFGGPAVPTRGRGIVRARLRAAYAVNDWLGVAGQIATGDPDDPNSADITLSNFADDFQGSLDQVYARATFGGLRIDAGKVPLPFTRTELVWDGDVSPQGVSASYTGSLGSLGLKASSLYFLIDEAVAGPDSRMIGGQLEIESALTPQWRMALGTSYYDYSLKNLTGADVGDFRSNRIVGGRYVSDFNLVDIVGSLTYTGFGERGGARLTGNVVRNVGAADEKDSGYGVDLLMGRLAEAGDWRVAAGYATTETDAVLAAFSHDNIDLATNYRQVTLGLDHAIARNLILNATLCRFRVRDLEAASRSPDWSHRLRVNALVAF